MNAFRSQSADPHVHCVVPGDGLTADGRWIGCRPSFFLPVRVLSRLYRRLFLQRLQAAFVGRKLEFFGALTRLREPAAFARHLAALRAISNGSSMPNVRSPVYDVKQQHQRWDNASPRLLGQMSRSSSHE